MDKLQEKIDEILKQDELVKKAKRLDAVIKFAETEKDGMSKGANDGYWGATLWADMRLLKLFSNSRKVMSDD